MKFKRTILLITTTHLAKNPRLVKEIDALHCEYKLVVIFFQLLPFYKTFDDEIIKKYPDVIFKKINWLKKYYPSRFCYTVLQKALLLFWKLSGKIFFAEQLFFPGYLLLKRRSREIDFDLIHGHNPGCMGVVYRVSKAKNALSGFDAEDYHSGEYNAGNKKKLVIDKLEDKYLPKIDFLLGASPLICEVYKEKFPGLSISTINNCFPSVQFHVEKTIKVDGDLKLIWFSQNVGLDRGLDEILKALQEISNFKVSFTIIGTHDEYTRAILTSMLSNTHHRLIFKGLMSNEELNQNLSSYHIGIASEPGKDLNNAIALSNKIFAYTQAGLAILASNTPAQQYFMNCYNGVGCVYEIGNTAMVVEMLNKWQTDREFLLSCRKQAITYAKNKVNWEHEADYLKVLIGNTLHNEHKKLKIAITVDPEIPVPPTLYGGIERIVYLLVEELCKRGHSVVLFAHPSSKTSAKLIPWKGKSSPSWYSTLQNCVQLRSQFIQEGYDVIHSFSRLAYLTPLLNTNVAKVMSYQREPTLAQIKKAKLLSRNGSLHFTGCSNYISEQMHKITNATTVYNGINLNDYRFEESVDDDAPLIFLGRIEEIKGTHLAIELAKKSKRKLIIAGNIPKQGKLYFSKKIRPQLDENITYIGAIDDIQKNKLLGTCAALLMPILWDEPFGIVMVEAMACGTPVVAFERGAVNEILVHGKNGYIATDFEEMLTAISNIASISRYFVRTYVEQRFSAEAIVDQYLEVYEKTLLLCKKNKKEL